MMKEDEKKANEDQHVEIIPKAMLAVAGVAPKRDHRRVLHTVHIKRIRTRNGYRLITEATDGKAAIRAIASGNGCDEARNFDAMISLHAVAGAKRLNCKVEQTRWEKSRNPKPIQSVVVTASDAEVRIESPVTHDAVVSAALLDDLKYPECSVLFGKPNKDEYEVTLSVDVLERTIKTLKELGVERFTLRADTKNEKRPLNIQGVSKKHGFEVLGLVMPYIISRRKRENEDGGEDFTDEYRDRRHEFADLDAEESNDAKA